MTTQPAPRLDRALALAAVAAHLAVAGRYDFFRDELYFIICGRHPAFGYLDQPPLVPLLAAASQLFGEHLVILRAVPALAAGATVYVTCRLARVLGATDFGATLAGLAAASAPIFLGLMGLLGTSSFGPLTWTLIALLVARALVEHRPRLWLWAGVVAGVDLEIKYALPIYLLPLLASLVLTGHGKKLLSRPVLAGAALAVLIAAPSALWQWQHGFPFLEMIRNQADEGKNVVLSPLAYLGQQVLILNPLFTPLWLAGLVAPFVDRRFAAARPLALAFALASVGLLLMHAKDYFAAPLYGAMFASGGAALEAWVRPRWARVALVALPLAASLALAPLAMPILPEATLVSYLRALGIAPKSAETLRQGELPQTFADMHGWRELTASVTEAVAKLTPEERDSVVIFAHNYGEAAALDFYGRELPTVVSGHNQYGLWGLRGAHPSSMLTLNREKAELERSCAEVRELTRFTAPWVMPFEDDSPITLCKDIHPPLETLWPGYTFKY